MTRPPVLRLHDELIVDNFAGGGGASLGIEWALGRSPDIAVNHDPEALAMHQANHPATRHLCESVWDVNPREVCAGRPVGLAWFSPDCTYHSKARGGKPFRDRRRARRIRGLAWVVIRWAKAVQPRVIILENVEEWRDWGPLADDGRPCPRRRGQTFRRWVAGLEAAGYRVEWRELKAHEHGAPTIRKRLFVIARCDGQPIVWPEPTHGPGRLPYRVAAECIDWSIPCPSIFDRKKPLAENTLRRIARGLRRYVIEAAEPFIVPLTHQGERRAHGILEPLPTVTGAHRGELALVAPTLINTRNGEREGQAPRVRDIRDPFPTVTAAGSQGALVTAFLARHYGGHENDGAACQLSIPTITAKDHHALVTSHLLKLRHHSDGQDEREPLHTIAAGGTHFAEVRAFLVKFYGNEREGHTLQLPLGTVTTKDRFGLVTVHGEQYVIADIGMRMLTPRELFLAQGFAPDYVIDPPFRGKPLTKTAQTAKCGNSVSPPVAEALVRAQFAGASAEAVA